jgi:hypothetical protein
MTSQIKCDMYYSISGDPFELHERHAENIEHINTILNIYTKEEEEEVPNQTALQQVGQVSTELSVPYPIKKGQFFNSESCCMFFNEAGELLKINGTHLFRINMLRDASDFERLHVKFDTLAYEGKHSWENISVEHH